MNIETVIPYSWLKSVSRDIPDEIPLWGAPPPFPWKLFSNKLSQALKIEALDILPDNQRWRSNAELLEGLGVDPLFQAFSIAPLKGCAYLIFPKEDLKNLLQMTSTVTEEKASGEWIQDWDEEWRNEFYQFLSLHLIQAFQTVNFDNSLSLELLSAASPPEEATFCIDLKMTTPLKSFIARLSITDEMRSSFKEKHTPKTLAYPKEISEVVTAIVHVTIGNTTLLQGVWNQAGPGDVLLLDSCTYIPGDEKGRVLLTLNNKPIFRAKLKDKSIKLLEYPLLQEVQTPMAKLHDDNEFEDPFSEEDETISEDHDFDHEEDLTEEDESKEEDLSAHDETMTEVEQKKKTPVPPPSMAGKELLNQLPKQAPLIKAEDIPLTISVEIAQIQMSIQQLMQLAPGNMLDLDITPENGVDLIVNGRCIAKGELLKFGETLGVRILDKI